MKWLQHLRTINHHKKLVMQHCFRVGLYWQGLTHDLSKYSWIEFSSGAKYFQGNMSPNNAERKAVGYSKAWLHHKGRNRHHLEYWMDYSMGEESKIVGMKMPVKYVVEMFCDRVAASKNYRKEEYRQEDPYLYYAKSKDYYIVHPETQALLEKMLITLRDEGEDAAFLYIRKEIMRDERFPRKQWKKICNFIVNRIK